MKRLFLLFVLFLLAGISAFCQPRVAVLRVNPFTASGVSTSETAMLERLIVSFIAELNQFRIVDDQGQEMALSETESALSLGTQSAVTVPLSADYIVTGALGKLGDLFVVTLENTKVASGEKLSVSDTAPSISDLVRRSKELTLSLFGRKPIPKPEHGTTVAAIESNMTASVETQDTHTNPAKANPAQNELVGTWRGDKGLETVRIFPNGTGLAVLSGGGTLKLKVSIIGDTVEIAQDQPNEVSLYRASSVTLEMARKIASKARPMRWVFKLATDGQRLFGTKHSVSISGTGASMQIDNSYVRDASWTRLAR